MTSDDLYVTQLRRIFHFFFDHFSKFGFISAKSARYGDVIPTVKLYYITTKNKMFYFENFAMDQQTENHFLKWLSENEIPKCKYDDKIGLVLSSMARYVQRSIVTEKFYRKFFGEPKQRFHDVVMTYLGVQAKIVDGTIIYWKYIFEGPDNTLFCYCGNGKHSFDISHEYSVTFTVKVTEIKFHDKSCCLISRPKFCSKESIESS